MPIVSQEARRADITYYHVLTVGDDIDDLNTWVLSVCPHGADGSSIEGVAIKDNGDETWSLNVRDGGGVWSAPYAAGIYLLSTWPFDNMGAYTPEGFANSFIIPAA